MKDNQDMMTPKIVATLLPWWDACVRLPLRLSVANVVSQERLNDQAVSDRMKAGPKQNMNSAHVLCQQNEARQTNQHR